MGRNKPNTFSCELIHQYYIKLQFNFVFYIYRIPSSDVQDRLICRFSKNNL